MNVKTRGYLLQRQRWRADRTKRTTTLPVGAANPLSTASSRVMTPASEPCGQSPLPFPVQLEHAVDLDWSVSNGARSTLALEFLGPSTLLFMSLVAFDPAALPPFS